MKRFYLPLLGALLLSGCSKLAVYEPDSVADRLSYDERLEGRLIAQTPQGATLDNGQILPAPKGVNAPLSEGFVLLGIDGGGLLAADEKGGLLLRDAGGNERRFTLPERVLSAATDGEVIAVTTRANAHRLLSVASGETLFLAQEKTVQAVSVRLARPLLSRAQAVFPTLDGKLLIVDRAQNKVVREQVVGTEEFFGNLIFLGEHENHVIAATQTRVIALGAGGAFFSLDKEVRLLSPLENGLYLFTLDGSVTRLSGKLETLESVKLPYARIVAAAQKGDAIYAIEQSGWIIRLSLDLKNRNVYELPDDIRAPLFAAESKLYYGRKAVYWP